MKRFIPVILSVLVLASCTPTETWEGAKSFSASETIDLSGKKLVIKEGTTITINDSVVDGTPIDLTILADEVVFEGKVVFEGVGEPGKDGANEGAACANCANGVEQEFKKEADFNKACQDGLKPEDQGQKGDDGTNGGRGAYVTFKAKVITGQENVDFTGLKGGVGGLGKKGGANRIYIFKKGTEVKKCQGFAEFAPNGANGNEGEGGMVNFEVEQNGTEAEAPAEGGEATTENKTE